jgi:L-ascorbate metabolism protein UlaG (beta-lactamase superfamily)
MKRRELLQNLGTGFVSTLAIGWTAQQVAAQSPNKPKPASPVPTAKPVSNGTLRLEWLGHTCFLLQGEGKRILVNPFAKIGCTAGYRSPAVAADYVLLSSRQLDEGNADIVPGNPQVFYAPGVYQLADKTSLQGIRTDHDRIQGKRFGTNIAWRWTQGGINLLHLGGIASDIGIQQKILMGSPDVLIIPVGGKQPPNGTDKYDPAWPETYTPEEAKAVIATLNPRLVIPTHYRTQAADAKACDLVAVQDFTQLMAGTPVRYSKTNALDLSPSQLPSQLTIQVMGYQT